MSKILGFIGTGNMGSAIIGGVADKTDVINAYDIKKNENLKVHYKESIKSLVNDSDVVVFCVKPNMFETVLNEVKTADYKDKLFISIAAGITKDFIKQRLGNVKLVRVMPNLPLCVGEGMSVVSPDENLSDDDFASVKLIFESSGKMCVMSEDYINKAIAVNGSGPAYVFMFIEAMADALVKNGVDRKNSYTLAAQTVLGSAKMLLETNLHPGVLKDMVCSPAGTTIDAVIDLEKNGFRHSVMSAVQKCTEKAIEMSKK
ncbi:MAG: pyrroline-5-carboxylate reductase [Clostridia bacterium]|nr:pyrroline-5-carboxylate reductase [Oscillospiraceae bacterium]MDY5626418.1 pyrroline-5-carboxylate reductase [Clostridia bacterium]